MDIIKKIDNDDHYDSGNNRRYIVMHDTGNYKDTAMNNANYFCTGSRGASAHYFVDENSIVQVVEDSDCAWHCGDGKGKYGISNSNSIGIEMCNSGGYISENTINNAIWLVKKLQSKYGIDNEHVVRHYDASRKICPGNMSANNWAKWYEFKSRLQDETSKFNSNELVIIDNSNNNATTKNVSTNLLIREYGSSAAKIIGQIPAGSKFEIKWVDEKYIGWYYIDFNGIEGYVSATYVEELQQEVKKDKWATTKNVISFLNIREEPNVNSKIIKQIPVNGGFHIKWTVPGWHYISYYDTEGYVNADYVKILED